MKRSMMLLLSWGVLLSTGCKHVETVEPAQLEVAKRHYKEPKVSSWYYMGSREGFDYFIHIDLGSTTTYRLRSSHHTVGPVQPLSSRRDQWQLMPWGANSRPEGARGSP